MRSASYEHSRARAAALQDALKVLGLGLPDSVDGSNGDFHHQRVDRRAVRVDSHDIVLSHARHGGDVLEEVMNHRCLEQHWIDDLVVEQNRHRA
jgi:hypothetical protein